MPLKPHTNVIWIDEAGEVRLYDAASNEFQNMNETGSGIWRLAIAGLDVEEIVDQLSQAYQVQSGGEQSILRHDVQTYVQELLSAGLLVNDS